MMEEYVKIVQKLNIEKKQLEKRYSQISTLRILVFLAGAALTIIGIADGHTLLLLAGIALLAGFILLIKLHGDNYRQTGIVDSKLTSANRYIDRANEKWREFEGNGSEFLTEKDTVASDVDLLGPNSLYQLINVCHTEYGNSLLVDDMKQKSISVGSIKNRQEAVGELIEKREFAVNFEGAGIRLSKQKKKFSPNAFAEFCMDEKSGAMPGWTKAVRFILPAVELTLLILSIAGLIHYGYPLAGFLIILAFTWLTKGMTDSAIMPFYLVSQVIDDYVEMLSLIADEKFDSEMLKALHGVAAGENGGLMAFKSLDKLSQAYNVSFNPLIHQLLSGFFLWDYQLAFLVNSWKKKYGSNVAQCFEAIGRLEELLSLSVIGQIRKICWPVIHENTSEKVSLRCEQAAHPLIAEDRVVTNSASLEGGIIIITGSNMSGKTTFLRTLAANLALAYMGAPVCAERFEADYMDIYTSMRVTDDVANGISTFYAEILRIKAMADAKKSGRPMICLIDEIFKGTNSADRIVGAREAITKLAAVNCMTIVSTHDFELCIITDKSGKEAVNYHFQEYYEDDQLRFDYKIKADRCTTTNAMAILKMAGF